MSEPKSTFIVKRDNPRRMAVVELCLATVMDLAASGEEFQLSITAIKRTLDQNAAMWPALTDVCKQVPLTIFRKDGSQRDATTYDWKDVLTAAFEEETEWAPGLRGGVVMLGARTSQYSKRKMADFLTFIHAEFSDRVTWSEKAKDKFEEFAPKYQRAA